jgi:histone deacetylase 1/2
MSKRRVSYFYDNEVGSFYYGQEHPMKPFRMKMAHQLIVNYGLYRRMNCFVSNLVCSHFIKVATQSY